MGVSLFPKLACPLCWPAYAGLLSSVGLGFLISAAYLLPLTVAFLTIAIAALGFRARSRRGFGPMLLGLVAAAAIVFSEFFSDLRAVTYVALALLFAASVWNSWPRPAAQRPQNFAAGGLVQLNVKEKE